MASQVLRAASLFSGIGAPEVAMPQWNWIWHAEIEKFPSAVMAQRHPQSVNLGDVTADDFVDRALAIGRPDVVIFGSPCQSYSVAGQRLGLADPRGNLALIACGILARLTPRWFVFENVPGLLSSRSGGGWDFGVFLGAVRASGYQCAWASLDAQFFGVAQRRERVFVVGHSSDWRRAAAVLLEPESLCGHSAPIREAREGVANSLTERPDRDGGNSEGQRLIPDVAGTLESRATSGGFGTDFACMGGLQPVNTPPISLCLNAGAMGRIDAESETLIPIGGAFMGVRRLMPVECERLQGFSDDYTAIPYRGKPAKDGPRYKAIGNSMAVPVVRWILSRVELMDQVGAALPVTRSSDQDGRA